jgi:hypothetical protein
LFFGLNPFCRGVLLNKTLIQKEEQIPFLEESDRRPFFIFVHDILFIITYSCLVKFVLARAWIRRGRGLGAYESILFNTASCIKTTLKEAKKPGVKDDFGSNISAVPCTCLEGRGQEGRILTETQRDLL